MQVEEEIGEDRERDRNDVDDGGARLDEGHAIESGQHAGSDREEPHGQQLTGEQVHQRDQCCAKERRHEAPAEGVESEEFDANRENQLGERRLRVEVVLPKQVLVRVIGKVQLVEHEGRVGRDVVRLTQSRDRWVLVVMSDPPGADRRRGSGVGEDVKENRAGEAKESRDQGESDQPVEVGPVEPPPGGARGSPGGWGLDRRDWLGSHQLAWPRNRPLICATKSSTPTIGTTISAPATMRGPSCRSADSSSSDWRRSSRM